MEPIEEHQIYVHPHHVLKKDFYVYLDTVLDDYPKWRKGQAVFNLMYYMFPEIANKYRGSDIDPFHNDENCEKFVNVCFEEIEKVRTQDGDS